MKSTAPQRQKFFPWRLRRHSHKPAHATHPRRGADFGSVVAWTTALVCWTLLSHLASPPPRKAEAPRESVDLGEHMFSESLLNRSASALETTHCAGSITPVVRTQPCDATARKAWRWSAPNALREAMGDAPCWWHASATDLAKISGITESWAERIIAERRPHTGDLLRVPEELESVLGAHRTRLLAAGVSLSCAVTPLE